MDRLDETGLDKLVEMVKKIENTASSKPAQKEFAAPVAEHLAANVKSSREVDRAQQGDLQAIDHLRSWGGDDLAMRHLDALERQAVYKLAKDLQARTWRLHLAISITIHTPETPLPPAPGPEPVTDPNPTPPGPDPQPSVYDDPNAKLVNPDECLCGGPQGHLPGGLFCRT